MPRPSALVLSLFLATGAFALDPHRALTQARLSVWNSDAGLPQNTIDAIVQTRDGYLWMGTEEGLARFDGVRFVVSDRQTSPALRSPFVSSLFESSDGTLWIGTYGGGLARQRHGRIEAFRPDVLGAERIRGMVETASGSIYIATAGGGMLRIDGDRVTRFTTRDGLPVDRIWTVISDGANGLWVATHGGGVVRWRDGKVTERITSHEGLPNDFARTILRDADGTLWIGTDGDGLAEWRNGAVVRVLTTRDGLPSNLIRSIIRDHTGSLLIGTDGGLVRWRDGHVETLGAADGLPAPIVTAVIEDREGSLWVGTSGGVVRLNDTKLLPFTRKEGLAADAARAILEDREGRMWVGTEGGGLCRMLPAPAHCFTKADGLPQETVYALTMSRDGSLWAGTDGGGVVRMRDGKFTDRITALPNDHVRSLVETADGTLWVSTSGGLASVRDGKAESIPALAGKQLRPLLALDDGTLLVGTDGAGLWRVTPHPPSAPSPRFAGRRPLDEGASRDLSIADEGLVTAAPIATAGKGLGSDRVFSLTPDSAGGAVWVGTSGGGLTHLDLKSGATHTLARRDGLHDDVVFQLLDDGKDLWMTSNRGLYRVGRDRVLAAMRGEKSDLTGTVYGSTDGMPSAECTGASPAAIRARDGRIWVATSRGVAVVDFNATARNPVPPVVHIDGVVVDGNALPDGRLRIRAGAQRLEVHYTAVSLRAPERVTFRYRLEGFDPEWVDAGTNRVAHYTKLPAGDYTFYVTAANEDGVPSVSEERLTFTVEPAWFETWWARLLGILLIAGAIYGAIRIRVAAAHERILRTLSYLDGLTGVANRRRFDEALEEACGAARRAGTPLSLALIDLDHFKELNDTSGHMNGDDALRTVARLLAKRAQSAGGLVARFGGEEFAWLLPGIPPEVAKQEAESFRLSVLDAGIRHAGVTSGVLSASVGVAGSKGAELQPSALIAAADAALYRAKSAGRDRVEIS